MKKNSVFILFFMLMLGSTRAQISPDLKRYVRIGELQSVFSSWGAERAWNNTFYEGLSWPSQYPMQDNAVIERFWLACKDYTNNSGVNYPYYGIYFSKDYVDISLFPMGLKQIARGPLPDVYVNGIKRLTDEENQINEYDPNLPADRVVINVVNTSMGLTMTRKIHAFTHPNHDDYFIKVYTFKNTGNTDYDGEIERTDALEGVRIGKLPRYSVCREGASNSDNQQMWGKHSWVSKRGENYAEHTNDIIANDYTIADWIRCGFSWMGQSELFSYDMVGAPNINNDGRLTAPQFAGVAVLHVDKSAVDQKDDPQQPAILGWHAGDTYPRLGDLEPSDSLYMHYLWNMLAGNPYSDNTKGGSDRMDESNMASITDPVDPYTIHGDGGGTGIWIGYGPFDLAHGESVTIVEVDGVNGLSREKCLEIGENWLQAYENPSQEYGFKLPDGATVTGKYSDGVGNAADVYKNSWFYTGIDSLLLTFSRAKRNYDSGFAISDAPPPPMTFEILSDTNSIQLKWDNSAESYSDFGGYRIYRRSTDWDLKYNPFELLFECGYRTSYPAIVNEFIDSLVDKTYRYQYCMTTFDKGTNNGGIIVESNIHSTMIKDWVETGEPVITQNVYVSPDGDDENDGLTAETAFKTIHHALEKIQPNELHPLTIYLAEGEYSPSVTGEQFPLAVKSYLTLKGVGNIKTILNAEGTNGVIRCSAAENLDLKDFSIINGNANNGGGIYLAGSDIRLAGIRITNNYSSNLGGGLYSLISTIEFDQNNRCDIFNNYAEDAGSDIYCWSFSPVSIYLDTFTVQTASAYHLYPPIIQMDILNTTVQQLNADLYVSPQGNDKNTGLTIDQPLKSIRTAVSIIYANDQNQHTIYLDSGIYSTADTSYSDILYCRDFVSMQGKSAENTILDSISVICNFVEGISINDITIMNGMYSGISGYEADFKVSNSAIAGNGGNSGIYLINSNVSIDNCVLKYNNGGIFTSNTNLTVKGSTIRNNYGLGIHVLNNSIIDFNSVDRNSVYLNGTDHSLGGDLYFNIQGPHHVCLDTFTYLYPIPESVYPLENFTFDIRAAKLAQINGDAYVSPEGDDSNMGDSWSSPLKTINRAMELLYVNEENPRKIFLDAGVYSISNNDESFPIMIKDFVSILGSSPEATIIDAERTGRIIESIDIQNCRLSNLRLRGGRSENGGAMIVSNSHLFLDHLIFQDDSAKYGAAIYADNYSFLELNQVAFVENQNKYGNAIYADNSNIILKNVTIANNTGSVSLYCNNYSPLIMINSIIWDEVSYEIVCRGAVADILIAHSDLMNGESGIRENDYVLNFHESNMSEDPKFVGGSPFNYMLLAESPCIDAGTSLFIIGGDTLLYIPDDQYSGTAPDIGAYQIMSYSGISEIVELPNNFRLYPNYPNPFNPSTTIAYDLPEVSKVKIIIYDILGREVQTLVNKSQNAGHHTIRWNGCNDQENPVAAGIYFVRCIAGDKVQDQKMLLLK